MKLIRFAKGAAFAALLTTIVLRDLSRKVRRVIEVEWQKHVVAQDPNDRKEADKTQEALTAAIERANAEVARARRRARLN